MTVGDLVQLNSMWNRERAFVYDTYESFEKFSKKRGICLITESGRDLAGFSPSEQHDYLKFIKSTGVDYEFKNVIQLARDFESGVFAEAFES